jgi:hypothetical protein
MEAGSVDSEADLVGSEEEVPVASAVLEEVAAVEAGVRVVGDEIVVADFGFLCSAKDALHSMR